MPIPYNSMKKIIKKADEDKRILITDDKDFGELVFRLGKPIRGVILFRTATPPQHRSKTLINLMAAHNIQNTFIVIKRDAVRIRRTPKT